MVEDRTRKTSRNQMVKNLCCQAKGFELFLKAMGMNARQQVICIQMDQSESFVEYRLDGASPQTGKSVEDAITLNWANRRAYIKVATLDMERMN